MLQENRNATAQAEAIRIAVNSVAMSVNRGQLYQQIWAEPMTTVVDGHGEKFEGTREWWSASGCTIAICFTRDGRVHEVEVSRVDGPLEMIRRWLRL